MDIAQRIAQFENMTQADPENEMAHFSLAGAYAQAGRHAEAAAEYLKCSELAPGMSKAYQLAGESYIKANQNDTAAQVLTRGYVVATERGDRMPQTAIADLLKSLGKPVPEAAKKKEVSIPLGGSAPAGKDFPAGTFVCTRTGRPGTKLARPPFKGPVGAWIAEHIARETWDQWIGQGTKVINELRLNLAEPHDGEVYDQHMREYLGIDEELYGKLMAGSAS